MSRKWLWVVIGILVVGFMVYRYVYQPHRDIKNEEAAYTFSSEEFIREFREDAVASAEKYVNKVIRIDGEVTSLEKEYVAVDNYIIAQFGEPPGIKTGERISFKGRFLGYDELLEEIRFDECYILNH
ncbi:OB-fold protein [Sinomicrobium weinanense]|uniref:tRNA_anti-like n=1 Tax=Sinomicrobium weinanense TaxID=2842200 RepID=A0A926JSJ0_9FLAO|nr:hypothetical protein [Sinomicrobium weinanense]MBC9796693.1 hypothetical protein [Sinomicrobium weinanense]MBU3123032.1 hypothetical protein [Sinomicrobium weinanense]